MCFYKPTLIGFDCHLSHNSKLIINIYPCKCYTVRLGGPFYYLFYVSFNFLLFRKLNLFKKKLPSQNFILSTLTSYLYIIRAMNYITCLQLNVAVNLRLS